MNRVNMIVSVVLNFDTSCTRPRVVNYEIVDIVIVDLRAIINGRI